jgi:RNA polymerase sigma factor (sigma-70 family)
VIFFQVARWAHVDAVLQRTEGPADAELISAVRGGDADAFGELFDRHVAAARRLARQLVPPADADDLVSEAFAKVFSLLQRGSGPDLAFRAYLLTAIRRLHVDRIRANARLQPTDNLEPFDPGVPFRDTAVEGFENAAAAKAFTSLPERWQAVLWHTEVEDQKPAEVAVLLGMSANSVSALAYRAREGLRQAFLTMHLQELEDDACAWTHQNLGAYVRNGISRRDATKVENHLSECRRCTALYLELTEVNSNLSGLLAPLLLGSVAAAYVGTGAGVAGLAALKGGLLVLLGRAKDIVAAHAPASAAAGVAAAVVVAGGVFVITDDDPRPAEPPTADGQDRAGRGAQNPVKQGRDRQARPERRRSNASGDPGVSRSSSSSGPATLAPAPAPPTGPGAEPGGDSGPDSTGGPGPQPGPSDTPPNEQQPNEQPPNDPPPTADLRVTATASSQEGAVYRVTVEVSGLAPGGAATLSVAGRGVTVVLTHDGRCDSPHPQTCRVTSTPTTFEFTAVAAPGSDASVVFTVSPDDGTADADRSNNRATVPLGA